MARLAWLGAGIVGGVTLAGWTMPLGWMWVAGAVLSAALPVPKAVRAVLVGLFLGLSAVALQPSGPALTGWVHARGRVAGAASGRSAPVLLDSWSRAGGPRHGTRGRVWVFFPDRPPATGTEVLLWGRAGPAHRRALPGAPDPVRSSRRGRIHTLIRADRAQSLDWIRPPTHTFDHGHGALLTALATGDRSGVPWQTTTLLRRTGTAHVLAISGFHVGLVGALSGGLVLVGLRALAVRYKRGVDTAPAYVVGASVAVLYALSAGAPTSAVRAAGLLIVLALCRLVGRHPPLLQVLAVVAGIQTMWDPTCVGSASFQLSYGAVLGLLLVSPHFVARIPEDLPPFLKAVAMSLSATLGATVGTLGPAAWWLQSLPVLSPIANLIALPITAIILVPCALIATWAPQPVSYLALTVGSAGVWLLTSCLSLVDGPVLHPAVGPIGALVLGALPLIWHRRWLVGIVLLGVFVPRPPAHNRLTMLDVGQGDSVVIDQPDGTTWLVDTGPGRRELLHYLRRTGRTRLDVLVATHNHPDHIAGLGALVNQLSIGELWVADTDGIEPILDLAVSRGVLVRIRPGLDPTRPLTRNHNDASIVFHTLDTVLMTGDAEQATERRLLGLDLRADVLKVGHHGSRTSTTGPFLDAVDPLFALASNGRDNAYGHPHPEVAQRLDARNIPLFSTSQHGSLQLDVDGDWLTLTGHHAGSWRPLIRWHRGQARAQRARTTPVPRPQGTTGPPPATATTPGPARPLGTNPG